jgi:hypothetical protein
MSLSSQVCASLTLSRGVQGPIYIRTAWDNCIAGEQAINGQSRRRGEKKKYWYVLLPVMRPEMLQIQANFGTEKPISPLWATLKTARKGSVSDLTIIQQLRVECDICNYP